MGMDWSTDGKLLVSMVKYLVKILKDFIDDVKSHLRHNWRIICSKSERRFMQSSYCLFGAKKYSLIIVIIVSGGIFLKKVRYPNLAPQASEPLFSMFY